MGTTVVHAGVSPCEKTGAILTPIYQSTTFVQPSIDGTEAQQLIWLDKW